MSLNPSVIFELSKICTTLKDEPMSKHTTFKIGGPADAFCLPRSDEAVLMLVNYLKENEIPFFVVGNGSNLLVSDDGYRGVIIKIGHNMSDASICEDTVYAQSGVLLSMVCKMAAMANLGGGEALSGIPGSIGGAVYMNAGAYGTEIKDVCLSTTFITNDGCIKTLIGEAHEFGYRESYFSKNNGIVLSSTFKFTPDTKENISEKMLDYKTRRASKQPLDMPSSGSTFKRPEGHFAGALIEQSGLRGVSVGGAQVSEKHCGFVVNKGGATAKDVIELCDKIENTVFEKFGVKLEKEMKLLGF